jgi:uncharacterized Zn finger protein (UPF0148 family)
VLLTCPQCRCGLQVPDGTTAKVRCPACKTIFSPNETPAPEPPENEKPQTKQTKPASRKADRDEDEPRNKKGAKGKEDRDDKNRDFDPIDEEEERRRRRRKRRSEAEEKLTPEEKAERRAAFNRAAAGAKCIWISLILYVISMVFLVAYQFVVMLSAQATYLVQLASVFGMLNWTLAAIGVGLCLSGPPAPGKLGYGIMAALAVAIHLMFLFVGVILGSNLATDRVEDAVLYTRVGLIPTTMHYAMFYLATLCYPDQPLLPMSGSSLLLISTGILELFRTMFIMMLLSCLARAALDEELAYRCTRAAGIACGAPAAMAIIMLGFVTWIVETGGAVDFCWFCITGVMFRVLRMGVYAIVSGTITSAFMAARDVDDAMEEPFQSLIPEL